MHDRMQHWDRGEGFRGRSEEWAFGPGGGHESWVGDLVHVLIVVLVVAALALAIVWLVRRLAGTGGGVTGPALAAPAPAVAAPLALDPAVAALRLRYARGEVSREDFQQAHADLTGEPTATWPGEADDTERPTAS